MIDKQKLRDGLIKGIDLTEEECMHEMQAVITIKENEVIMEGHLTPSPKRELYALRAGLSALEREKERSELLADTETMKDAIDKLKTILEEATRSEDAVCYVTDVDADALKAGIAALERVCDLQIKLENHRNVMTR